MTASVFAIPWELSVFLCLGHDDGPSNEWNVLPLFTCIVGIHGSVGGDGVRSSTFFNH